MAVLHKQEMLCWDEWSCGGEEAELTSEDEVLLDQASALSLQPDLGALSALWLNDPRLHLPSEVHCYSPAVGPHTVKVI